MKKFLIATLLVFITFSLPFGNKMYSEKNKSIFQVGEFLKYEVSFLGITLGWITVQSEGIEDFNGNKTYKAQAIMDSRDGIPFVDLWAKFNGWMDPSLSYSHNFTSSIKDPPNSWLYDEYHLNYDDKKIGYKLWKDDKLIKDKQFENKKKVVDGTSLFFLARQFTNMKRTVVIPTLITDTLYNTHINFRGDIEGIKIDAIDYKVRTLFFDGRADWEGIYGLNGKFKGWFSDDDARIPIKAEMNVYVGNVDITLIEWKRDGWKPPKM